MKNWIEKNINPPGLHKRNRGSLYAFAARVFAQLKEDAMTAFNAHFPYLSDPEKLREHGRALSVPELPEDTEAEYRDRVAAASFYLMKAGERSYILDRLQEHFGARYTSREAFLQSQIEILDADDEDIKWARGFLDEILDPNIFITIFGRYGFKESFPISDRDKKTVRHTVVDSFLNGAIKRNGRILRDGTTIRDTELDYLYRNGSVLRNGSVVRNGQYWRMATGRINVPVYRYSGIQDLFRAVVKSSHTDTWGPIQDFFSAVVKGSHTDTWEPIQDFFSAVVKSGHTDTWGPIQDSFSAVVKGSHTDTWEPITETFEVKIQFHYFRNGTYFRDGAIDRKGNILFPLE
jgi:hypothetical protein